MKTYNSLLLFCMMLLNMFIFAGCRNTSSLEKQSAAFIPEKVKEAAVKPILGDNETNSIIKGQKIEKLKIWVPNLLIKYKIYEKELTLANLMYHLVNPFEMWNSSTENKYVEETVSEKNNNILGIQLSTSKETAKGLTLICTQSGGKPTGELFTGSKYELEKKIEEQWILVEPIQDSIAWNDDAWIININDNTEWEIEWEWLYGTLPSGNYRISKEVSDFRKTGDYDTYIYYAEFEITD